PIVFCTAFDEYALQAFRANGVEYLLKPFNQEMVANVFEKLKQLQNLPLQQPTWLQQMLTSFQKPEKIKSLLVYMADKIKPIAVEKVALFYLAQEKTYLQTFDNEVHLLNQTLNELELLVGEDFFRANRQTLIHRHNLLEIEQYFSRKLLIKPLKPHSEAIVVSKEKTAELIRWVKGET
ncbi:MAG: LytR/AlgR family response regulator transcription factor, partial [Bacteroidia bacterium]